VGKWLEIIGRSLRALHLDSIRKQILVLAVAATLLPALALIVVLSRQSRGSLGDQIAPKLRGVSAETTWEVDQWLLRRFG